MPPKPTPNKKPTGQTPKNPGTPTAKPGTPTAKPGTPTAKPGTPTAKPSTPTPGSPTSVAKPNTLQLPQPNYLMVQLLPYQKGK